MLMLSSRAFTADLSSRDAGGLSRILNWGSRPWEPRSNPTIVNAWNGCEHAGCAAYFILDIGDLRPEAIRLPKTPRELAFVWALQSGLRNDGPAVVPILVFSAPDNRLNNTDFSTIATTRRLVICDRQDLCQPAAAILLNSRYWGTDDAAASWQDRSLAAMVARHELYHAKRVWQRAQRTAELADAIEMRFPQSRTLAARYELELSVSQSIAAREEIEAIDCSLRSTVMAPTQRAGVLRYREEKQMQLAIIDKKLIDQFQQPKKAHQELSRWIDSLFRRPFRFAVHDQ